MSIAHYGRKNCSRIHERRSGNNSIVVVGIAFSFHQGHTAAIGTTVEVSALDLLRAEESHNKLFRRNSYLVSRAVVVVQKLWSVRHARRNQRPARIRRRRSMACVRHGGTVAVAKRTFHFRAACRRNRVSAEASHAEEHELSVPVCRKPDLEPGGIPFGFAGPFDIAKSGQLPRGRHVRGGSDRHFMNFQGSERIHSALPGICSGPGSRQRRDCGNSPPRKGAGRDAYPTPAPNNSSLHS